MCLNSTVKGNANGIEVILEQSKIYLDRWMILFETIFPLTTHNIPPSSELTSCNSKEAVPTSDAFNHEKSC